MFVVISIAFSLSFSTGNSIYLPVGRSDIVRSEGTQRAQLQLSTLSNRLITQRGEGQ